VLPGLRMSSRLFFTSKTVAAGHPSSCRNGPGAARIAVGGDSHLDDIGFTADGKTDDLYPAVSGPAPRSLSCAVQRRFRHGAHHLNDEILKSHALQPLEEVWSRERRKPRFMLSGETA